ncbi:venom serine carboxypeptidase-like [Anthonomus grandis grandis]|uniref:venom serine carboxypeptidase-like n=1 Tax=Anthonomus grandis grandis TaxID=2921223 RepID=UPI0021654A6E|nr:venom serine carboxypeptidase-like [Anthonomus grandis grandis]
MSFKQLLFLALIMSTEGFFMNGYPKVNSWPLESGDDPGVPLLLTPLIEAGKIDDAQMASEVYFNGFLKKISYSGFFTVDKLYNSNMFFWFFPCESNYENASIILWLQGGPGASSLIGLFSENGPFIVKSERGLKERPFSWTKTHSVLYIDNPVGTGYSFTEGGYAQNETKVGEDLYETLQQFFTLFPNLQTNDFYISGESYAGKYVPAIAYTIHTKNPLATTKINLKGLTIGNGYSDPINQLEYGDYLYQLGLYDDNTRNEVKKLEQEGFQMIQNKEWAKAANFFDNLMDGDFSNSSFFKNVTGFENYFNVLNPVDLIEYELGLMAKYIQRNDVRAAIHVGNATFHDDNTVEEQLLEDALQSVAPWISELLSYYRVLIYNGQLDIIVAYPLTLNYLQKLTFDGSDIYKTAPRHLWMVQEDIAGYVKVAGNLTEVLVRNAGHMVPHDQPQWAFDMINRFTNNKPFF